jgi:hypothetical protein
VLSNLQDEHTNHAKQVLPMDAWDVLLCGLGVLSGLAAPCGLFRLCLWLAHRSRLYRENSKPGSSAASCFVALQKVFEPPATHVLQVKEHRRAHAEEETPVQGNPEQEQAQ